MLNVGHSPGEGWGPYRGCDVGKGLGQSSDG